MTPGRTAPHTRAGRRDRTPPRAPGYPPAHTAPAPARPAESELKELQEAGARREVAEAPKSLAEQLQEHKDARAEALAERERLRKQGKNRPLDEDEIEWIEGLEDEEEVAAAERRIEERRALAAFQTAQQHARETAGGEAGEGAAPAPAEAALPRVLPAKRAPVRARVAVRARGEPDAKRPRPGEGEGGGGGGGGLGGLLGAYGSDSDSGSD